MRKALSTLPAIGFSLVLLMASPASASVTWDGDASAGTGVFAGVECDDPGSITVAVREDRGSIFKFNKPAGLRRCEGRGISVNGSEYVFANNNTYYLGWETATNTDDAATIFQWKSYPNSTQNYPVLMKVEGGELRLFHITEDGTWILLWSQAITVDTWKHIALGIHTSESATGGWIELYYNGAKQTLSDGSTRYVGRTWDTLNKPKWGTYGAEIEDTAGINWIDSLKVGTTYEDVAP